MLQPPRSVSRLPVCLFAPIVPPFVLLDLRGSSEAGCATKSSKASTVLPPYCVFVLLIACRPALKNSLSPLGLGSRCNIYVRYIQIHEHTAGVQWFPERLRHVKHAFILFNFILFLKLGGGEAVADQSLVGVCLQSPVRLCS